MENKINIAELLKDCPTGMELDCTCADNVVFDKIIEYEQIKCVIGECREALILDKYGRLLHICCPKCVIFPKGKTTWKDFQIPFKDGDIAVDTFGGIHIMQNSTTSYCYFDRLGILDKSKTTCVRVERLATEEEKEKLFKAIKDNGYRWNEEAKTLEKYNSFYTGEVLVSGAGNIVLLSHVDDEIIYYHCILEPIKGFRIFETPKYGVGKVSNCILASKEQRDRLFDRLKKSGYKYNPRANKLEKLPRFKVGDIIRTKKNAHVILSNIIITKVKSSGYEGVIGDTTNKAYINLKYQDEYELVPNKFDINTLVPFESRVLVRDVDHNEWEGAVFGRYDGNSFFTIGGVDWRYCIPYEGNEHLFGTTNDCEDYYKTW